MTLAVSIYILNWSYQLRTEARIAVFELCDINFNSPSLIALLLLLLCTVGGPSYRFVIHSPRIFLPASVGRL